MKLKILIPIYRRLEVANIVIQNLYEVTKGCDVEIICCGDKEDKIKNVSWFEYPNKPVSNKFNALFESIRDDNFDYAIIVGSDDLISQIGWDNLLNEINKQKYHFIGFKDCTFYNSDTVEFGHYSFQKNARHGSIGCYRALHKNLLETLGYKPYFEGLDSGIDYGMDVNMKYLTGIKSKIIKAEVGDIIDIKTKTNINSFEKLRNIFTFVDESQICNTQKQKLWLLNTTAESSII